VSAFAHTCAIDERGIACWGDAQNQQFGVAGDSPRTRPQRLAEGDFIALCTGERHACALRRDGQLGCWGGNGQGQLGLGDREPRVMPAWVEGRYVDVACGGEITCAIGTSGELSCWGSNAEGTLGQGDAPNLSDSTTPLRVARELRVAAVSVGQAHACLIEQSTGALSCWGRNTLGQTGSSPGALQVRVPTRVDGGRSYVQVAAAQRHTCAIASDGALYCWGENQGGLLGQPTSEERVEAPAQVGSERDYVRVSASWFHSCALREGGELACWGRNIEQQLGVGDTDDRSLPTRVAGGDDWRAIAVGRFHTCAVRGSDVYCWGDNREGQLGLSDLLRRGVPTRVTLPP
jgi:alpha-tubulin suppressor-like RCC1 family protein